jgi:hypothetical protein
MLFINLMETIDADFMQKFNDFLRQNLNIENPNIISSLKEKRNWIKLAVRTLDLIDFLHGNSICTGKLGPYKQKL